MREALLAQHAAGLISRETTMSLLGVDDVEAEEERLRREADEPMDPRQRIALGADRRFEAIANDTAAARALLAGGDGADVPEPVTP
jgi:hypothetical protein